MRSPRGLVSREEGLTLVELLVAMSVLSIVLASVYGLLFSVQNGFERQVDRSTSLDQARLAMLQIDKEIRSASAYTSTDGVTLDAYTRTNEVSASGSGSARDEQMCVEWRVTGGELQTRMWSLDPVPEKVVWRTTATDIVNDSTTNWMFKVDEGALYSGRLLNVRILANAAPASGTNVAPTVEINSSLSGRNINGQPDPCYAVIAAGDSPEPK